MTSTTTSRWPWMIPILVYAAATREMIIMVKPFAAYFYSVYTPLLHGLEASAATAWLPQLVIRCGPLMTSWPSWQVNEACA